MSALEEKTLAAAAWEKGDFEKAIEHYSRALELTEPSNKELLKTLYSNRSAAYMK